ncbi:hypothetical protein Syun_012228 [Stephania yunnanensis]|uniref:Uncharacterized protein n=1 Tax=Stephania yunnanensis TaxID=152371 RepID=A0AAP0JZ08_9MAGN
MVVVMVFSSEISGKDGSGGGGGGVDGEAFLYNKILDELADKALYSRRRRRVVGDVEAKEEKGSERVVEAKEEKGDEEQ